jgi:hypothetical protein
MASPGLSELVTTTLRNRSGVIADNMGKNNALLNRLNKRGRVKPLSGGRTIVRELSLRRERTFQRYSGLRGAERAPSDVISAAEFDWKQASVAVTISGLEQRQNSGADAVLDLLESRIEVAEKTMQNNLSSDMYSDGTAVRQADRRPPAAGRRHPDLGHRRRHQPRHLHVLAQPEVPGDHDGGSAAPRPTSNGT